MIIYKIEDDIDDILGTNKKQNLTNDFKYMTNLVSDDYQNYFKASEYLQSRYEFSLHAIDVCLSKVNNDTNRLMAYKELSKFLKEIRKRAGIDMEIVKSKTSLYVKEKPKVKSKFKKWDVA